MKAALKYPVFYLAPAEHMVYVFWREENVTTRRLLAEADGWAGQEVVDASGRRYTIRRCLASSIPLSHVSDFLSSDGKLRNLSVRA